MAQGLPALAAHGLHFFAAHGLQAFGAQGLQAFAPQGLHFFTAQGLALAAACNRGTKQALLTAPPPAAHGLQGLHGLVELAAEGLQGLHFATAQGLHFAAAQGLAFFDAHCAIAGRLVPPLLRITPPAAKPAKSITGITQLDRSLRFLEAIVLSLDHVPEPSAHSAGPPKSKDHAHKRKHTQKIT